VIFRLGMESRWHLTRSSTLASRAGSSLPHSGILCRDMRCVGLAQFASCACPAKFKAIFVWVYVRVLVIAAPRLSVSPNCQRLKILTAILSLSIPVLLLDFGLARRQSGDLIQIHVAFDPPVSCQFAAHAFRPCLPAARSVGVGHEPQNVVGDGMRRRIAAGKLHDPTRNLSLKSS